MNGTNGKSPVLTPITDANGKTTGYTISIDNQPAGTITDGKDGSTPDFTATKDDKGNVTGYTITIDASRLARSLMVKTVKMALLQ
ncbi:hypothetical protein [Secundilactobacillus silagei]|uniref:hypothetical protein n=1 Tax=Secundilactobacillus silagei TaxID=1293415 RepID=UPI0006D11BAC|nr:hypothetical protein [Secundilactobacillus silagei]